jgi:hypothetical protein
MRRQRGPILRGAGRQRSSSQYSGHDPDYQLRMALAGGFHTAGREDHPATRKESREAVAVISEPTLDFIIWVKDCPAVASATT